MHRIRLGEGYKESLEAEPTYDPRIKDDLRNSKTLSCLQIQMFIYACRVASTT